MYKTGIISVKTATIYFPFHIACVCTDQWIHCSLACVICEFQFVGSDGCIYRASHLHYCFDYPHNRADHGFILFSVLIFDNLTNSQEIFLVKEIDCIFDCSQYVKLLHVVMTLETIYHSTTATTYLSLLKLTGTCLLCSLHCWLFALFDVIKIIFQRKYLLWMSSYLDRWMFC